MENIFDIMGVVSIFGFALIITVLLLSIIGEVKFKSMAFGLLIITTFSYLASTLLNSSSLEVVGKYSLYLAIIVHFYNQQSRKSVKAAILTLIIVFILEQVIA